MNHLNPANLKDVITSTLQEILAENPNFFWPNQLKILSWKSKKIEGALITKIGNVRYLGLLRKDIKGQEYWKYHPLTSNSEPSEKESSAILSNSPDNLTKFQQRQSLVEDQINTHGKNSEPSINQ